MPKIDWKSENVIFDNGVASDRLYEPHGVVELKLGGVSYWLGHGHEQIIVWDIDGNQLFETFTR